MADMTREELLDLIRVALREERRPVRRGKVRRGTAAPRSPSTPVDEVARHVALRALRARGMR